MLIALTGAHGTGKSTLAREYAKANGAAFLETSVSAIFRDMGLDPAAKLDFPTRLTVQEEILKRLDAMYQGVDPRQVTITDRSPLCMLAYTLGDCNGDAVGDSEQSRLAAYIERAFEVCNRRFSMLVVVQPGIPLVKGREGKAVANAAYMEQLNTLVLGLTCGGRLKTPHYFIPRPVVALDGRLKALEFAVGRTRGDALVARSQRTDACVH